MHIELSNACNHACLFCSNPLMQRKKIADDKLVYKVLNEAGISELKKLDYIQLESPLFLKN